MSQFSALGLYDLLSCYTKWSGGYLPPNYTMSNPR